MNRKLKELLNKYKSNKFRWGRYDCCIMANDVVKLSGHDLMTGRFDEYKTKREAIEMLRSSGKTIEEIISDKFEKIDFKYAVDGDLVMIENKLGNTITIKVHGGVWCVTPSGANLLTNFNVIACWRVHKCHQ